MTRVSTRTLGRSGAAALFGIMLLLVSCGPRTLTPQLHPADARFPAAGGADDYLKVHMSSGELFLLDVWEDPTPGGDLAGSGTHFDADRNRLGAGSFVIPRDEIALLETNSRGRAGGLGFAGLAAYTTLATLTTVVCLADPKSCFGSCPTFYATDDPDRPLAEGFSSSFARVLEEGDIDRLGVSAASGPYSLVMRNEAQETHAVRHVRLLAVPKGRGGEALLTPAGDLLTGTMRRAAGCQGEDGDCLRQISEIDDTEYAPRADEHDLARREEVVLDFGPVSGDVGVVLSARNSLVTTYVFYQSLAYAGRQTGDLLAALERGEPGIEDRVLGLARELGGIDVFVSEGGSSWRPVGVFDEAGPIAADRQVIRVGEVETDDLRVLLRMARGSWRIDEVALAELAGPVEAITLEPDSVTGSFAREAHALDRLMDPEAHLVTLPGDAYRIWFTLPDGPDSELFLDTRGYYYEWMRASWLEDESAPRAAQLMLEPREALRVMTPGFKQLEPDMERLFWSSRFRRQER